MLPSRRFSFDARLRSQDGPNIGKQQTPRGPQEAPKTAPRAPKITPRGLQETVLRAPEGGLDRTSPPLIDSLEDGPKRRSRAPKRAPREPQE
eukprot:2440605-Pyramimonas_sp.AAC.1